MFLRKRIIIIIVLSVFFVTLSAQKSGINYLKFKNLKEFTFYSGNNSVSPYYLSIKPVTNREYITYLMWLAYVYQQYPLTYYNAIPGLKWETLGLDWNNSDDVRILDLVVVKAKTESYVKDYMFNARYIDYPVIGLTWEQSGAFCHWLSDRYNEYLLIEDKVFDFNSDLSDNNCFTTESYLSGQYEGLLHKGFIDKETKQERNCRWSDKILSPSFRLPATFEIPSGQKITGASIKPYKMFSFLERWHQSKFSDNRLFIWLREFYSTYDNPLKLAPYQDVPVPLNSGEWYLDSGAKESVSSISEIFNQKGQKRLDYTTSCEIQKDSTGHMTYLIIGETPDGQPIIVENYVIKMKDRFSTENSGKLFRVAVSAVKVK